METALEELQCSGYNSETMQAAPWALLRGTTLKELATTWLCGVRIVAAGLSRLMEARLAQHLLAGQ